MFGLYLLLATIRKTPTACVKYILITNSVNKHTITAVKKMAGRPGLHFQSQVTLFSVLPLLRSAEGMREGDNIERE